MRLERLHDLLDDDGKAGSGLVSPERLERVVVTAAACQGGRHIGREGSKDHARVVVERRDDGEVDHELARLGVGGDKLVGALQVVETVLAAKRHDQGAALLERLLAPADARELGDGLGVDGLGAPIGRETVDGHQIRAVKRREDLRRPRGVVACLAHEGVEHADRTDGDGEVLYARGLERLEQQAEHLGVGHGAAPADELDARLHDLTVLTVGGVVLGEDVLGIAQAKRPGVPVESQRGHARDGKRHVGTQDEQVVVAVEEPKRGVGQLSAHFEHVEQLDRRRLDGEVPPEFEALVDRLFNGKPPCRLGGQHVAKTAWRLWNHGMPSPYRV